jgi:uncharacterized protein (TIGR03437 family)
MGRFVRLGAIALPWSCLVYGQSTPVITSVVDPYTGGTVLSPGGMAVIKGGPFGSNPQVSVGGKTAATLIAPYMTGNGQMTIEIPINAPLGAANVVVTFTGPSAPFPINLTEYAPVLINSASGTVISPQHQTSGLPVTAAIPAAPGETVVLSAIGLGPTNPSVATGVAAPSNAATSATATVTLGNNAVPGATAMLAPGRIAIYQITFTVPPSTPSGSYPIAISIGGVTSNSLTLPVGAPPSGPAIASLLDPITASAAICPGGLAVLSGVNFDANPTVTINGKTAFTVMPPQSTNPNQMTIEIPVDIVTPISTTVTVIVTTASGQASPPFMVTLFQYAPVLYNTNAGTNAPVHQTTGLPVTAANPALPNETIGVFAIGLGPTSPVAPTGTPSPPNVQLAIAPTVMVNSATPTPATAALVPGQVGLYEITFTMPAALVANPFIWVSVGPPAQGASSNFINIRFASTSAAPSIDHLANNYSYVLPGFPTYGIAQGSIFDIFGANLTNLPATALQSAPLTTMLDQATVAVTVNGTTTQAYLYYVTPGQIAALLPSGTPVGDGTLTVTNNVASASTPIHVVQSAFGILTLNNAGTGPASAFDLSFKQLGFTNALNPGDYFVLWGTGVGPVPGADNVTQTAKDLSGVPFSIEVGGVAAQLVYHGRSQYPGLDQVIGIVPQGVTPGCWVSVATRSGMMVSNFATLPVAASGRICSDPGMGITVSQMQSLTSRSAVNLGALELQKAFTTQFGTSPTNPESQGDTASASFLQIKAADFTSAALGPSIGSCLAIASNNGAAPWEAIPAAQLDAGSSIGIAGGSGSATIQFQSNSSVNGSNAFASYLIPSGLIPFQNTAGSYSGGLDTSPANRFIPASGGGQYTFSNGAGGGAIGPFQANSAIIASPLFNWPQGTTLNMGTVNLNSGITVNWSSGDPNSYVQISGRSPGPEGIVAFTCSAPATAGQFTIPSSVLTAVPAASIAANITNPAFVPILQITQLSLPQSFAAPSLDFASVQSIVSYTIVVNYQ